MHSEFSCLDVLKSVLVHPLQSGISHEARTFNKDEVLREVSRHRFAPNNSTTVIAEIFVRVKISYSSLRGLSYAINFRTARAASHTLDKCVIFVCYKISYFQPKVRKIRN